MNLLTCKELTYSMGYKQIFKKLSFSIQPKERILLTGENGSGKSTLLKLLFSSPNRKEFQWNPSPISISYLGHEIGLYSSLSLRQNLDYFGSIYPNRMEKDFEMELLESFGLKKRVNDPVSTFSEGMKRKAGLIRALLAGAELLLLDEPLNGLDANSLPILEKHLETVYGRGSAVVLVTHGLGNFHFPYLRNFHLKDRNLVVTDA